MYGKCIIILKDMMEKKVKKLESLQELRGKLDVIDQQIVKLFEERMTICEKVADLKAVTGKAVFDPVREEAKLEDVASMVSTEFNKAAIREVFQLLMSISRERQQEKIAVYKEEEGK